MLVFLPLFVFIFCFIFCLMKTVSNIKRVSPSVHDNDYLHVLWKGVLGVCASMSCDYDSIIIV